MSGPITGSLPGRASGVACEKGGASCSHGGRASIILSPAEWVTSMGDGMGWWEWVCARSVVCQAYPCLVLPMAER